MLSPDGSNLDSSATATTGTLKRDLTTEYDVEGFSWDGHSNQIRRREV